ncbi:MAG: hypothetical protein KDC44_19395, partial [Phaeodactylibacter sp.]|nr:hypothetical protein [Phaeodactylibacter sp.]
MKDWLDNALNEKFQGQQPAFDIDQAWERLDRERRRRKRLPIFFWWSGSLLAALTIGWLIWAESATSSPVPLQQIDAAISKLLLQQAATACAPMPPVRLLKPEKRGGLSVPQQHVPIDRHATTVPSNTPDTPIAFLEPKASTPSIEHRKHEPLFKTLTPIPPAPLNLNEPALQLKQGFENTVARPKWRIA